MNKNIALLIAGISIVLLGVTLRNEHQLFLSQLFMAFGGLLEAIALVLLFLAQKKKAS